MRTGMIPDRNGPLAPLVLFGAEYLYLLQLLAALLWFLRQPRSRQARVVAFALPYFPLVLVAARIVAHFYFDPRPFVTGHFQPLVLHAPDNGFVSDHALLTSAVATLVLWFDRPAGIALWLMAALVGASRVLVGVHHPIDVLGAYGFSLLLSPAAWLVARRWLFPRLDTRLRRPRRDRQR